MNRISENHRGLEAGMRSTGAPGRTRPRVSKDAADVIANVSDCALALEFIEKSRSSSPVFHSRKMLSLCRLGLEIRGVRSLHSANQAKCVGEGPCEGVRLIRDSENV